MRKNSIYRCGLIAAAACVMFGLTGCHGSKESYAFQVPESFDESRSYDITFWAKNDTNKTQTAIYQEAVDDFHELYPNINVNIRFYTDYGKLYNDVITNISTQTTPNVCITYPDHIATYLTGSDNVVALDELFRNPSYGFGGRELLYDGPKESEIVPEFLEEGKIGGVSYAIPYMRSTEACYINKTFVEKLGYEVPEELTWDFIWEVSEAAMEKDGNDNFKVNGQKVMIPFIYKSTDNMMIQMLRQREAGYSTSEGEILLFNDTTRELLKEIAVHAKSGAFSTFKISSYPANFLNAGQCIFAIDSTAGATWMGSEAPLCDISKDKIVSFETVVRKIPQYQTADPKMISQGPSICIFNKQDPQEVLASWLFAQYLLTNDVQIAYAQTEGYVPVTGKAQSSEEYQAYLDARGEDNNKEYAVKIDATQLLLDNVGNTFTTPVFNGSASLRDAAGQMIENVTKSVRRKKNVDEKFLDELEKEIISLYHLDQIERADGAAASTDLGPLPKTAVGLLGALAGAWILILAIMMTKALKKRRNSQ